MPDCASGCLRPPARITSTWSLKPAPSQRGCYLPRARAPPPRASGVEVATGLHLYQASPRFAQGSGGRKQYFARKEVIVCGGAFNTPQLLMLSGIGEAQQLKDKGIDGLYARRWEQSQRCGASAWRRQESAGSLRGQRDLAGREGIFHPQRDLLRSRTIRRTRRFDGGKKGRSLRDQRRCAGDSCSGREHRPTGPDPICSSSASPPLSAATTGTGRRSC